MTSPSPRRAWIEMSGTNGKGMTLKSPSPRRAWIEIVVVVIVAITLFGRPPHGGRGLKSKRIKLCILQSFCRPPHGGRGLKYRGFYQHFQLKVGSPSPRRAWIEITNLSISALLLKSPSPRRAWIEIIIALRLAGSDRSPSPRRAWIEIKIFLKYH